MRSTHSVAGIIRISPTAASDSTSGTTLAELFGAWGQTEAELRQPWGVDRRQVGIFGGPRQHKLRADLTQIRSELDRELAGFLNQAAGK